MEHNKYQKLIDLIINEQEDKANELFHEIVVEKSRQIYESIMDEEMMNDMDETEMVGEVGDLMDEISAEESGDVVEAEEDIALASDDMGDEMVDVDVEDDADMDMDMDMDADMSDDMTGGEVDKGDLASIKDKLDELMAEFEEIMGADSDAEDMEDMEDDAEDMADDEEDMEDDMEDMEDDAEDMAADEEDMEDEESLAEAVQLQKVPGLYNSKIGGDDGANKRSVVAANSGARGMGSKPVKFAGDHETVPNGPKAPSNYGTKGEKEVPGAGSFGNAPGQKGKKLSAAPKPVTSQASGVNNKSPVSKG